MVPVKSRPGDDGGEPVVRRSRNSSRLWWISGFFLCAGVAGLTWRLLGMDTRGSEVAGILSLAMAGISLAAGGVAAWFAWVAVRDKESLDAVGQELLRDVIRQERPVHNQLLGDVAGSKPADVTFAQPPPSLIQWRTDGGAQRGTLRDVSKYYDNLSRGRLVVLGRQEREKRSCCCISCWISPSPGQAAARRAYRCD